MCWARRQAVRLASPPPAQSVGRLLGLVGYPASGGRRLHVPLLLPGCSPADCLACQPGSQTEQHTPVGSGSASAHGFPCHYSHDVGWGKGNCRAPAQAQADFLTSLAAGECWTAGSLRRPGLLVLAPCCSGPVQPGCRLESGRICTGNENRECSVVVRMMIIRRERNGPTVLLLLPAKTPPVINEPRSKRRQPLPWTTSLPLSRSLVGLCDFAAAGRRRLTFA